jgi:hypothetical protein
MNENNAIARRQTSELELFNVQQEILTLKLDKNSLLLTRKNNLNERALHIAFFL